MNPLWMEKLLLLRIEEMKEGINEKVRRTGINSQETITHSQELDILLNLHMKHFIINKKEKSQ
jgi:hypothetical protein